MITKDEVTRLVTEINSDATRITTNVRALIEGKAWETMGLPSWDAFCDEYLSSLDGIGRNDRLVYVKEWTEQGVSTRAQAKALGVKDSTIRRDQDRVRQNVALTKPAKVVGLDGRETKPKPQADKKPKASPKPKDEPKIVEEDDLVPSSVGVEPFDYLVRFNKYNSRLYNLCREIIAEKEKLEPDQLVEVSDIMTKNYAWLGEILDSLGITIPDSLEGIDLAS